MHFRDVAQRFFDGEFVERSPCLEADFPHVPELAGTRLGEILKSFKPESRLRDAHNRLLGADRLAVEDGVVVFCEENQNASYWGVAVGDCTLDDPPVLRCQNEEPVQWFADFESLDSFFAVFCLWQAMNGAWPFYGMGTEREFTSIATELGQWEGIDIAGNTSGLKFYCRGNDVIAAVADEEFFIAARSSVAWERLSAAAPKLESLHDL